MTLPPEEYQPTMTARAFKAALRDSNPARMLVLREREVVCIPCARIRARPLLREIHWPFSDYFGWQPTEAATNTTGTMLCCFNCNQHIPPATAP